MIKRLVYLHKIRPLINRPVIKVITGIRRCGKSILLQQIITELKETSVTDQQIVYINKELFEFDFIKNYKDLHNYITSKTNKITPPIYLFIDEVQEIEQWEKAISSLLAMKSFDIYITGSNARLMASDLATLLSGRYIELHMFTFTFPEFLELSRKKTQANDEEHFNRFLKYGGFPGLHAFDWEESSLRQYLNALYNTILLKDVVVRYNIRDAEMLSKVLV